MKKIDIKRWISAVAVMALVGNASAAIVLFDDFEDDTIGSGPPAIGGSNVGGGYTVNSGTIPVVANPETLGNTSSQVIQAGGNTVDFNRLFAAFYGGNMLINGMTISYDFYHANAGVNNNDSIRVGVSYDGLDNDLLIRTDPDGGFVLDGNDQAPTTDFGVGVWQKFTGTYTETGVNTYDLTWSITNLETSASINGVQAVATTSAEAVGLLFLLVDPSNGDDYLGYVDNVSVDAIPEPATLGLVGLLGGGLLFIRRRLML